MSISILLLAFISATAQDDTLAWSEMERVWGYEDLAEPPFMVADQNRTVHAMNSRRPAGDVFGGYDITYRRWSPGTEWTEPVDVMLSPKKDIARIRGLVLDDEGYLHMVFYGGDEQDASMYYTAAPASTADRAPSWSPPILIGDRAGPINDGALTGDGKGKLFVAYTGNQEGLGVYVTFSLDGGLTWSAPELVHLSAEGEAPTHYSLLLDQGGRLHVVWSEADLSTGNGVAIYYSRLDEEQFAWMQPEVLARAENTDFEVDTPALVEHDDRLILVYHDDFPTTRFMQQSLDHGETWSGPDRLFEQVGSNGPASFVIDSGDELHLFFGGRIGSPIIHGLWHSLYRDGDFSPPTPIVSAPRFVDEAGGMGFDPSDAHAIVVQGNTMLVTWVTDSGAGLNGVFSADATLNTPELPVVPLPNPATQSSVPVDTGSNAVPLPVATEEPLPIDLGLETPAQVGTNNPMSALLLGALPVALLLGIIVLGRSFRRSKV